MAYDAKKIYYRFDDHLSRLVLDYAAGCGFRGPALHVPPDAAPRAARTPGQGAAGEEEIAQTEALRVIRRTLRPADFFGEG